MSMITFHPMKPEGNRRINLHAFPNAKEIKAILQDEQVRDLFKSVSDRLQKAFSLQGENQKMTQKNIINVLKALEIKLEADSEGIDLEKETALNCLLAMPLELILPKFEVEKETLKQIGKTVRSDTQKLLNPLPEAEKETGLTVKIYP